MKFINNNNRGKNIRFTCGLVAFPEPLFHIKKRKWINY